MKTETFLRAAPRARLGKISSGQPSPGPFQTNLGMSPGVPQYDPEFQTHVFLRFSACRFLPNRFLVKRETFLRAAPRARLGKISSGQPSPGPFQPNLAMSPGVPQFDPEFQTHVFLRFSACQFLQNRFLVKTETFLRAAPRVRLGKISSGQPSQGPFPPNLSMSPRVPHFDPEFQTHLFLHFSACRFHPNRFPVKTETFLRAAPRARLGKISSGQPSPGPFQPNLGMSPGVPHFDPEFQTHVFLRFSACRSHPNRFLVKTETFLRAAPRARLGKISSGQPSPGPFQTNLGVSPRVPHFFPEFQTHVFLRFSACRFLPIDSWSKRKLFCAPRRARAWAKSVLASPAQGHSSQIWVCHRGYLSLTQNFEPMFSYVFPHADPTQIDSWSKRKLFCVPRRPRAWTKSVLASPAQGHSSQIWVCHRGYLSLTQNFKPMFSYVFQHADSSQIDSWSKRKFFCAPRRARAWAKSVLTSPAQGHSSQIWVCHRGYLSLTQNFKPMFSYVFQHADSSKIDSWSKRKLFCAPRRARAWAKSVLASPAQGHSSQIWVCHRGYLSLTQNFEPMFSYIFPHADPTQIDSWSKRKLFCAPRRARAWAKSVLASPAQGHSSQIWVCHRGYLSMTQNFKPMFSYVFQHADPTQIDSWSKRKLFCAPRRARAWAKSVLASPAQGHSSQIWVCHRGYLSMTQSFKPMFSYFSQHADSSQIDSWSKRKLFCAPRRARAWAKSVLASPAPGHSSQIWVCHRGYLSLTQNFKPMFSYDFQHADPTKTDSWSKRKLFCAPRRARAWAKSVLASPAQGHSSQIWVCHRGYLSMTQNFKPMFSYVFQHADSSQIDSWSKRKLFRAPRRARAWAKSVLASPAHGHSSQIWVCHRGYLSLTQNFKPVFSYVFQHADSSQIDSWSKRKLFCAPRRARAWAKSVLASPAQGHSRQIWVCHRGYPTLTQNFKPMFSYVFQHADSSKIDSWSKRKLFCAPRRARAWAKSVLASPAQGHSSQIWVCHRGYLSLTQNFEPMFSYVFPHADPTQIDSWSKRKLFCAPRRVRAWAKSVLASPAQGHSSQIWVCHRGYLSMTQNFKPMFSYVFQHADPTQIDSWSKRKLFCTPRRARAWAKSVLASPAQGHSSQIWVCHRGYLSLTQNFKPMFSYVFQHADSSQIDS